MTKRGETFMSKQFVARMLSSMLVSALLFSSLFVSIGSAAGESVAVWNTNSNLSNALTKKSNINFTADSGSNPLTINVNEGTQYQQMDGFGISITDASAWLLTNKLTEAKRNEVMENVFGTSGIGVSLIRQTIGASDFNWERYSYADTAGDWALNNFSIDRDKPYIIPRVKQALAINSKMKVMASPWSAPAWMKSTGSMNAGYLLPEAYGVYATYLKKFIQSYQSEGIPIYAITPQNEPLYATNDYPSMYMSTADQIGFIGDYLGPELRNAGLNTKIIAFDHNYSDVNYPQTVLGNSKAAAYIAGSAFHHYGGDPSAMTTLHNSFPNKDIWFTEGGFGSWNPGLDNMMHELIRIPRNWSKSFIAWNLALDQNNGPSLLANSINCGMLKIRSDGMDQVTYNDQYYAIGHFSKFVVPGAYRIDTNSLSGLENVAFKNPDGSKVVVAYNSQSGTQNVKVKWGSQSFTYALTGKTAVTFKWNGNTSTSNLVALKALVNNNYVSADNEGSSPLIANRQVVGTWETFERVDLGNGNIALKSLANNKYVCAENAGASQLIARSDTIGTWETFQVVNISGGIALKSAANGQYVSADNFGESPLIAKQSVASTWETFIIENR